MPTVHDQLVRASRDYDIPDKAVSLLKTHTPLIICGVTASGKNVIQDYIIQRADYKHVVTHTTRPLRTKEVNGVDHWFVSERELLRLLQEQVMIESQPIHGELVYGTSFAAFQQVVESGSKPIMDLNVRGIIKLAEYLPSLEAIFMLPPSFEVWMERLGGRDFMSDGEKARRLHSARQELEDVLTSNNFITIVNHGLDETAHQIMGGITKYSYDQERNHNLIHELLEYLRNY